MARKKGERDRHHHDGESARKRRAVFARPETRDVVFFTTTE